MTNKLWYEMVNIKYGELYLSRYLSLQRSLKKIFNIMTLIISLSGILSWKFFEEYAWIAFLLIAIMQLFTLIENEIIRSTKEIEEISELRMMYTKYFNKLERLWTEFELQRLTQDETLDSYFSLRQTDWEQIELLDCKLDIKRYNWVMNHCEEETNKYFNNYHHE